MKFTKLAIALLSSSILFCGCTKDNSTAIKVNDKVITKAEFNADYNRLKNAQLKNAPKEMKREGGYAVLSIKSKYVNDLVVRELLSQEFEKRKITASEEEIKAKKDKLIAQMGSVENFNKILKENNISEEKLNSDMASEVKMDKLIDSINKVKVTDSDAEKFYKEHKAEFSTPARVQASHILFKTNPEEIKKEIVSADKDAKLSQADIDKKVKEEVQRIEALANEVRQKALNNPKNFAQLAKEYSQDPGSAQNGGDLGYITKEQVVKEFGDAAFAQKTGTISPLVKSQFGTHIIYVIYKDSKCVQPYSTMKADIKAFLEKKQKYETVNDFVQGLKSKATIEFVDKSLDPVELDKKAREALEKEIQAKMPSGKKNKIDFSKNSK